MRCMLVFYQYRLQVEVAVACVGQRSIKIRTLGLRAEAGS